MRVLLFAIVALLGPVARADDASGEWLPESPGRADEAFFEVFGPEGRIVPDSIVTPPSRVVIIDATAAHQHRRDPRITCVLPVARPFPPVEEPDDEWWPPWVEMSSPMEVTRFSPRRLPRL